MPREVVFVRPRQVEVRDYQDRVPGPREVKVKVLYSGISHGTERSHYRGDAIWHHKRVDPDGFVTEGQSWPYPFTYGYEDVAQVVEVGGGVTEVEVGDVVSCMAHHRESRVFDLDYAKAGAPGTGLLVGADPSITTGYDGQMDDLVVATRGLTANEIVTLFTSNTTPTVFGSETIGHWKFENNWDDSGIAGLGANPWSGRRSWSVGDFDNDNDVDQHDLAVALESFGQSAVGPVRFDALTTTDTTPILTGNLNTSYRPLTVRVTVEGQTISAFQTIDDTWYTSMDFPTPLSAGTHDVTVEIQYHTDLGDFTSTVTFADALTIDALGGIIE